MAQARRAALSWKQQPPQDRLTDRVLEPALSQKLNRGTNGQAWEAALSRPQMSSPGQDLRRSPPLLHSHCSHQETFRKAPKTKELGAIAEGLSPWQGAPGAASTPLLSWELLPAGASLVPSPGYRPHPSSSQALGTSTP